MSDSLDTGPSPSPTAGPADSAAVPQPSEADVVRVPTEVEHATKEEEKRALPAASPNPQPWFSEHCFMILSFSALAAFLLFAGWVTQRAANWLTSRVSTRNLRSSVKSNSLRPRVDPVLQSELEGLVKRLNSGDPAAADLILAKSDTWTTKTRRTPQTDEFLTTAINLPDLHARAAAIQTLLALDGVPRDQTGFRLLQQAVGNPNQRAWALWSLGALGNRGVDPVHSAKILESYLNDTDPRSRANAVDGLAFLATDETLPMVLDRFRNDPSPIVQERAACALAESGMYTHAQRLRAAQSLIGRVDDPLLAPQQRAWLFQALRDITGESLGSDPVAWRNWRTQHHPQ